MKDATLEMLLETDGRFYPNVNCSCDEALAFEFAFEKVLSLIVKRLTGVSDSNFIVDLEGLSASVSKTNVFISEGDFIGEYYSRFIEEQSNLYSKLIRWFGKAVTLYELDILPNLDFGSDRGEGEDKERDQLECMDVLASLNKIEESLRPLGRAETNIPIFLNELYDNVAVYGDSMDYPQYCIYAVKSEELAYLINNKRTESLRVQRALDVFCNLFGDAVMDGVFWGCMFAGDERGGYFNDDSPMILDLSEVAALIILHDRIEEIKERR